MTARPDPTCLHFVATLAPCAYSFDHSLLTHNLLLRRAMPTTAMMQVPSSAVSEPLPQAHQVRSYDRMQTCIDEKTRKGVDMDTCTCSSCKGLGGGLAEWESVSGGTDAYGHLQVLACGGSRRFTIVRYYINLNLLKAGSVQSGRWPGRPGTIFCQLKQLHACRRVWTRWALWMYACVTTTQTPDLWQFWDRGLDIHVCTHTYSSNP